VWSCEACDSNEVVTATNYSVAVFVVCGRVTKAQETLYALFYDLNQIGDVSPHSGLATHRCKLHNIKFQSNNIYPAWDK